MVLYRYRQKYAFQMKYLKKKTEKNMVLNFKTMFFSGFPDILRLKISGNPVL